MIVFWGFGAAVAARAVVIVVAAGEARGSARSSAAVIPVRRGRGHGLPGASHIQACSSRACRALGLKDKLQRPYVEVGQPSHVVITGAPQLPELGRNGS